MNLQSWNNQVAGAETQPAATAGIFRQTRRGGLFCLPTMMSSFDRLKILAAVAVCVGAVCFSVSAQTNYYGANGTEYAVVGQLPGDQMHPDVALSASGGYLVWQDNATDGSGQGVSACQLDGTLSGAFAPFRVNAVGSNDQENARVALLKNGGAVFVWQGGREGFQHIFARFLNTNGTFTTTSDVLVNTFTNNFQINPAVAVLANGNVIVVWASYNKAGAGSRLDVCGQLFSPAGKKVGGEFLINQFINFNQRTPAVTALANGGFVVAWVSEQQRSLAPNYGSNTVYHAAGAAPLPSVDIYARLFKTNASPVGGEFLVDEDANPCATPQLATAADGSFLVAWAALDMTTLTNSWDIYARPYTSAGTGGAVVRVNTHTFGDQYAPKIAALNQEFFVVWTSLGQDGSREGVFGQYVHSDGTLIGGELLVNTTTISRQLQPVVASDGSSQFVAIWTSFNGLANGFDLYAQRYADVTSVLQPVANAFVYAPFNVSKGVYQPELQVSWPQLAGLAVSNFQVYVDGSATPAASLAGNQWTMSSIHGLLAGSTHSFQVGYVLNDGRRAPLSPPAKGKTWSGATWGGIPWEWMVENFGATATNLWLAADNRLSADGPTLAQVFLSGGKPQDSSTWLKTALEHAKNGMYLHWNTQPGAKYQVEVTTNLVTWQAVGKPRFAAGGTDSIYIGGGPVGYYRVLLLR
jgi:hypothetical protein